MKFLVVLTQYKRKHLEEQLKAIKNQTLQPDYLVVFQNEKHVDISDLKEKYGFLHVYNDFNTKFFGRFATCFSYPVDLCIVMDDDIIPGKECFEWYTKRCMDLNGIMGGNGRFGIKNKKGKQLNLHYEGETGIRKKTLEMDFVGHLWCFKKEWLHYMFAIKPYTYDTGEDMHLCFSSKVLGGIKSYACSQDTNEKVSDTRGNKYASDDFSSFKNTSNNLRADVEEYFVKEHGLKMVSEVVKEDYEKIEYYDKNKKPKIYIKSYCYSSHELPFVLANLDEGYDYIQKLYLIEYNYTHTGLPKEYFMEKHLDIIPDKLYEKLEYIKVDLSDLNEEAYNDEDLIHRVNEPIQRNCLYNLENISFEDDDIIIDIDIDEIILKDSYPKLLDEFLKEGKPMSIRCNQFFFKHNYLWKDINFSSPTVYKYKMVKNDNKKVKGISILSKRDLDKKTKGVYASHMSWIMPIDYMIKKLHSYSHAKYRKYADKEVLKKAIDNKEYIFDKNRSFNIQELYLNDSRIPKVLQKEKIFEFIE